VATYPKRIEFNGELLAQIHNPRKVDNEPEANAKHIVKCVNAFPMLIEALKKIQGENNKSENFINTDSIAIWCDQALAIAKGEKK